MKTETKRLLGSTLLFWFGIINIAAGVSAVSSTGSDGGDNFVSGIVIVLGVLAYRSAKQRLGTVPQTMMRMIAEIISLCGMVLAVVPSFILNTWFVHPLPLLLSIAFLLAYAGVHLVNIDPLAVTSNASPFTANTVQPNTPNLQDLQRRMVALNNVQQVLTANGAYANSLSARPAQSLTDDERMWKLRYEMADLKTKHVFDQARTGDRTAVDEWAKEIEALHDALPRTVA